MNADVAEKMAHRWHMDLFQDDRMEVMGEIITDDFVAHANGQDFPGAQGAHQLVNLMRTAFPDLKISHHETVVAGDAVTIRWTADATHVGNYGEVPPSGNPVHIGGLDLFHMADGKITEVWISFDNLPILQAGAA
jgi:steroid delta-isomerase-like uncharacterized protein